MIPLYPHLPPELQFDAWAKVIKDTTLEVFSRYYPLKRLLVVDDTTCDKKNGWYYIKDSAIGNNRLLGITDIAWSELGSNNLSMSALSEYGYSDIYGFAQSYGTSSVLADQMMGYALNSNINSLFSGGGGIYIETEEGFPNKFRVVGISGHTMALKKFSIYILLYHKDLISISPTKMTLFEDLARCDVAGFLYGNLKYWDGLERFDVNIDLKLAKLEKEADRRDSIIEKFDNSYVTYSNMSQPLIVVQ